MSKNKPKTLEIASKGDKKTSKTPLFAQLKGNKRKTLK